MEQEQDQNQNQTQNHTQNQTQDQQRNEDENRNQNQDHNQNEGQNEGHVQQEAGESEYENDDEDDDDLEDIIDEEVQNVTDPTVEIAFLFSRPEQVYFIGEDIQGDIQITALTEKIFYSIRIAFNGEQTISLNVPRRFYSRENHDDDVSEEPKNVLREVFMMKRLSISNTCILSAGVHRFNFSITPDLDGLTSFRGEFGVIRYEMSLILETLDHKHSFFRTIVHLIKPFDLNTNPNYRLPQESETHTLCNCWGILRGQMFCILRTPFGAYAPGQILKYTVELRNISLERLDSFSIQLVKATKYCMQEPFIGEDDIEIVIVNQNFPPEDIRSNSIEHQFMIPSTPPTSSGTERIAVKYILRAKVVLLSCPCSVLNGELPIIIGTVPLKESLAANQLVRINAQQIEEIIMPQPTFEVDYEYDFPFDGEIDYRPRYPMYRTPEP